MNTIGIIEDDRAVVPQIKLVLAEYLKKKGGAVAYKEYFIADGKDEQNEILREVLGDIEEGLIHTLFVDYKLNTVNLSVEGSEIIKTIREELSEFPMVILTNVVEDGKKSKATDADKVYHKEVFLNPDDENSEKMVENVFLNMDRYCQLRAGLEVERDRILQKMNERSAEVKSSMDQISELIRVETELQKFTPTHLMPVERIFPVQEYQEVLGILREYRELLKTDEEEQV